MKNLWLLTRLRMQRELTSWLLTECFYTRLFPHFFFLGDHKLSIEVEDCLGAVLSHRGVGSGRQFNLYFMGCHL